MGTQSVHPDRPIDEDKIMMRTSAPRAHPDLCMTNILVTQMMSLVQESSKQCNNCRPVSFHDAYNFMFESLKPCDFRARKASTMQGVGPLEVTDMISHSFRVFVLLVPLVQTILLLITMAPSWIIISSGLSWDCQPPQTQQQSRGCCGRRSWLPWVLDFGALVLAPSNENASHVLQSIYVQLVQIAHFFDSVVVYRQIFPPSR